MRVVPSDRAIETAGVQQVVQPQTMRVLVALAEERPRVVSRDRLIERAWDGRIVGDDAINRCILALRHLANECDPPPFMIETVPRIGHRLVEANAGAASPTTRPAKAFRRRLATSLGILLIPIVGAFAWQSKSSADAPASIAVLPFRNLSAGEPFFAQGLGEEVLGQLAREPAFRVAGRNATAPPSNEGDLGKLGRSMGVEYVLDGSVRSERGRIRVITSLIQASNGERLWSQTYERNLNDVFAIQVAIGEDVASNLKRALGDRPRQRTEVDGKAYALYLNARGLLRSGDRQLGGEAVKALEEVVRIDPGFAPGWSSLAEARNLQARTKGDEGIIAALPRARAEARRALRLDPGLAQAHGVMATLVGADTAEGMAHLRRAAALDGQSSEGFMWLAEAHHTGGRYALALATYHRATDIDPTWQAPLRGITDLTAAMGDRSGAEAAVRKSFADDPMLVRFALARTAWAFGDFSEAARHWKAVAGSQSRWASPAKLSLEDIGYILGTSNRPPSRKPQVGLSHARVGPRLWPEPLPLAAEWEMRNRSEAAEIVYHERNAVAAKLLLNAGRTAELVKTYDGPIGLLEVRGGKPLDQCRTRDAAVIALALRAQGRGREAAALIRSAEENVRYAYRQGTVPVWFEVDAAGVWAVSGNATLALDALERAERRGWVSAGPTDLPRIEDEPAFRSLHSLPRFEKLRRRLESHLARERRETARVLA
ncbi:MAG: winged helix-turn-helix domain-containing protein [Croceibacterium sp.]